MHPALKLFSILWLFTGVQMATWGISKGHVPYAIVGVILCILSITGICGLRVASMSLTLFWLSVTVYWVYMYFIGAAGPLARAGIFCLLFFGFAFIAFMCGEDPPEEIQEETEPKEGSKAEEQPAEESNDL